MLSYLRAHGSNHYIVKFMLSRKATKTDKNFRVNLTLFSKCQIYGEDFVNFRGLLRKYELYYKDMKRYLCDQYKLKFLRQKSGLQKMS